MESRTRFLPLLPPALKSALRDTKAHAVLRWWRNRRDLSIWERNGRPAPPPPPVKYDIIRDYGRRYGLRTLVETGTYLGDAVQANLRNFSRIYSIELGEDLWRRAARRFGHLHHVTILHGDSGVVLPKLAAELREPVLFWLDGHYSGGVTARAAEDSPILAELSSVLSRPTKDVVLIDDIRCFTDSNGYPSVSGLQTFIHDRRPEYSFRVENDIARLVPG
jgi:hypothetical protein